MLKEQQGNLCRGLSEFTGVASFWDMYHSFGGAQGVVFKPKAGCRSHEPTKDF